MRGVTVTIDHCKNLDFGCGLAALRTDAPYCAPLQGILPPDR